MCSGHPGLSCQLPAKKSSAKSKADHKKCIKLKRQSWCDTTSGTCHGISPEVSCSKPKPVVILSAEALERPWIVQPPRDYYDNKHLYRHRVYNPSSQILWTEMPSLSRSQLPKFFTDLATMLNGRNCAGLNFHRLVIRVPSPDYQESRGSPFGVSTESAMFEHLISKLTNPAMEIYVYPYLFETVRNERWKATMETRTPLEAVFKYVSRWNALLEKQGDKMVVPQIRVTGIAVDYEEGRNFEEDMNANLHLYKHRYAPRGYHHIRFGMAISFEATSQINKKYPSSIDEFYLEMYDWYVPGSPRHALEYIENHNNGALDNPARFLHRLEHEQGLIDHIARYEKHHNVIFTWSVQNKNHHPNCLYPMPSGSCGPRNNFGAWRDPEHYKEFLRLLSNKYPVFAQREHGMYHFSYIPKTWFDQC